MDTFFKVVGLALVGILTVLVLAILAPLGYAASGYLAGWVLDTVFPFAGNWIVSGAGAMGVEIAREQLSVIGAAIGFVGSFFKATQTNKVEK